MGNYGQPGHYEQPANGTGSLPKDHVTRTWDKHNIQNTYSKAGREAKMHADFLAKVCICGEIKARKRLLMGDKGWYFRQGWSCG